METIARSAGMEKGTLYHYFRSRADIVAAIHDEVYDYINAPVEAAIAVGQTPPEVIRVLIRSVLLSMVEYPGYLEIYFNNHRELPPDAFRAAQAKRDRFEAMVHSVIRRGVEGGYLSSDDTELTTMALFGLTNWSNKWFGPGSRWTVEEVTEHFFGIFMHGLAEPAPEFDESRLDSGESRRAGADMGRRSPAGNGKPTR